MVPVVYDPVIVSVVVPLLDEADNLPRLHAEIVDAMSDLDVVDRTCGDIHKARSLIGYQPQIDLSEGLRRFLQWYRCGDADADWVTVRGRGRRSS